MANSPKRAPKETDTKLVKELAEILDTVGLVELEYETERIAIRLSRSNGLSSNITAPSAQVSAPLTTKTATDKELDTGVITPDQKDAIISPMVGTVYTAPEPGAKEFVAEGDIVKAGQTLFIIEAMKVMNPITAPKAGKVTRILVQNAQPIEFG